MIEPFYRLSKRHAPPKTLTLDYTALPFGYLPIEALLNGHTLMFMVGFGTVMAEWLTILVTGLATVAGSEFLPKSGKTGQLVGDEDDGNTQINSGQETVTSFYWSLAATLFILLYMVHTCSLSTILEHTLTKNRFLSLQLSFLKEDIPSCRASPTQSLQY